MKKTLALSLSVAITSSAVLAMQDIDPAREAFDKIASADEMVMMPMRDGVRLQTDVYLPKDATGPVPVIFWKTPYDMTRLSGTRLKFAAEAIKRGYAFVLQNERGRYWSEGDWEILGNPRTDGYDALTWIADQPWSSGKVGTIGCSSSAEWQMGLAAMDHPAHAAMIPMAAGAGIGQVGEFTEQGNWYKGGVHQTLFTIWLNGVQRHDNPDIPEGMTQEELKRFRLTPDTRNQRSQVEWPDMVKSLPLRSWLDRAEAAPGPGNEMLMRDGPADPKWYEGGLWHERDGFAVPAFWFNSWYDVSQGPNIAAFNFARSQGKDNETRDGQYMVMAPTLHCGFYRIPADKDLIVGERNMGDANFPTPLNDMIYGFFDHYLKGEGNFKTSQPRIEYYTMGENKWKAAEQWPPKNTEKVTWYLGGWGNANSLYGDGHFMTDAPHDTPELDTIIYDPMNPVPSRGGSVCCNGGVSKGGVWDQKDIEVRNDVLVYSGQQLKEDLEVTGHIRVTLYVSSDARDTDFSVKLVDVLPDGTAFNVDDTIQRVKYRNGYDKPELMEKGEVYELKLSPLSTSHTFKAGHRVRLEISSSKFPQYMRNMNTGGKNAAATKAVIATNNVHHGGKYKSRIEMDVVVK